MILLCDSGSTKCDWLLLDVRGTLIGAYKTMGFNPFFHSSGKIVEEIRSNPELMRVSELVEKIYYYGAGCSQEAYKLIVQQALSKVFPQAQVLVDHDLKAAVFATYQGEPCISCILGTGSNAAWFDGNNLVSKNAGLGYILGDEASGTYFGKKLLAAYLYGQLPSEIAKDLEREYEVNRAVIFEKVYEKPHANRYLAGFTPFIAKYREFPLFDAMLYEGMKAFLQIHVCTFEDHKRVKTHFVGSVAYHFSKSVHCAAEELNIDIGLILQSPIENLLSYHARYLFPKQES